MPKVSVVLPFYNAKATLGRAIDSIAHQSMTDFECLLINNNSDDGGEFVAQGWTEKDKRFKLIDESRQGVMYASNAGAELAQGDYIARMDADDWAFSNRLALCCNYLDTHEDYGAVAGLVAYIPHHTNTKGFADYVDWSNSVQAYEQILLKRFIESPIVNPTAMWRANIGKKYGLYKDGDFPEDYEMWLSWLESGVKIHKLNNVLLKWYDSKDRLTRTEAIYSDESFFRIKSDYLHRFLMKNNPNTPEVLVWGASKTSRDRLAHLQAFGVKVKAFIDVKKTRQIDSEVIYYEDIPKPSECYILVYMKPHHIRKQINDYLQLKGYIEGENYLFVS